MANNLDNKVLYQASARLITEIVTLEDEKRKVRYLSPFAVAPSVASQVAGVLIIGIALANLARQKNTTVDVSKILEFLLWHDAPEARYGDIGRDQRKYLMINEDRTRADMFGSIPWGTEIIDLIENFEVGGEDINIKVARDADALYVIYTISDMLHKGVVINDPDVRIQKTLNRLSTEEGFLLGTQMATRKPTEIWKLLADTGQVGGEHVHPDESTATIAAVAWTLIELAKATGEAPSENSTLRKDVLEAIIKKTTSKGREATNIITDATIIYELLINKRAVLTPGSKVKNVTIYQGKFKTGVGKEMYQTLVETDLYDWWNLMMGNLTLNPDGSVEKKIR